jgi:predicted nucleotide-binding protein (sugar kinase/HSP70/actin superfamily)
MRMNTGQCIPLNAMVLESIRCVHRHNLDPGRTVLWMGRSTCACNIGMYPYYIKSLFETHGKGMEKLSVYIGDISHIEISSLVAIHTYLAYLFGGLIRKLGCQIRPHEIEKGETDKATAAAVEIFKQAFRNRKNLSYIEALEEALALFSRIRYVKTARPKVAIFGDLYMRDNVIMNQDLIHDIENAGGEVLVTPYNEYLKIISSAQFKKWFKQGEIFKLLIFRPLLSVVEFLEKKYFAHFKRLIQDPLVSGNEEYHEIFSRFNMRLEQGGESWDNILKIFHILKVHPDISLFVQTNPAFCCPALITEAQGRDIERITGVPVVTLTYGGTGTPINDRIIPYLKYPARSRLEF